MRLSETSKEKIYAKTSDQHWSGVLPDSFNVRTAWPQRASALGYIRDQSSYGSYWAFDSTEGSKDRCCQRRNVSYGKARECTEESSSNVTGYDVVSHARDVS